MNLKSFTRNTIREIFSSVSSEHVLNRQRIIDNTSTERKTLDENMRGDGLENV